MAPTDIFIYGASGHGKVVADIIRCSGHTLAGWIDDKPNTHTYTWEQFCTLHPRATIALGIGENTARESIAKRVLEAGYYLPILIHPSAIISDSAIIKMGSVVMPLAIVNADALIGEGCIVNSGAIVEHDCILDNYVHLSPNATLAGGVHVKKSTHIGMGALILQNIKIGASSVVAAGSVVTKDVSDNILVAGIPAIIKKTFCKDN
ncbi:MAG: acetyltransferase [Campylobacterales bacterium]|nr:acetyltransferase [Campylobacterales bacterium]